MYAGLYKELTGPDGGASEKLREAVRGTAATERQRDT
jgi:hypothetical protein